ncbi:MAG: DsbC family protein [Pseudomonadota bacterium]
MQWNRIMLAAAGVLAMMQAGAATPTEEKIKQIIAPRMGVNVKVDGVSKTPYGGLYEVRTNGDIFYTDESARYMFVGKVVDLTTYQDLTRARVDELSAIKFSDLPLEAAIKTVKGNGKRVMAIFEDPHCPYCRKLHEMALRQIDDVTIYTFLLNIVTEQSAATSRDIWCAGDRSAAWEGGINSAKAAPKAGAACTTPNEQVLALGKKLHIVGTPTIYFADGSRAGAGFDLRSLEAKLGPK